MFWFEAGFDVPMIGPPLWHLRCLDPQTLCYGVYDCLASDARKMLRESNLAWLTYAADVARDALLELLSKKAS